ncbi:hypothetical protein ACF07Y_13065 [Streptomyces sp. NPDC016566]|uniref:hypothetical protein n=1 Tax=Streptomyces sp. NPDC016566 TaxID=3364967 RepID=UPI0036F6588C
MSRPCRSRPPAPSPDSFRRVFGRQEFGRHFVNGVVVAGGVVIAPALIAFLAVTAVARFRFRFRTALPIRFPVARTAPVEGRGGFLRQILFPLFLPGLVAMSVFSFVSARNDFLFAESFIISDTSRPTPPTALLVFFLLVQRRPVPGLGGADKD